MHRSTSGFTVIELLVVIIILGVIAGIVVLTYGGLQKTSRNEERNTELLGWRATFEKYKAANGQFPPMANGGYCLGTGFPDAKCRDYKAASNVYTEAGSTALMSALAPYNPPAQGPRTPAESSTGATVGPYAIYSSSIVSIYSVLESIDASNCPNGATSTWNDGINRIVCRIILTN